MSNMTAQQHIRWLIRRDLAEVVEIEEDVFEYPWTEHDFVCTLRNRNIIGMVAEVEDRVAGYMIYCLHKNRLHLINLAVARPYWRHGVGTALVSRLISKLSQQRRRAITTEVRETNLPAQLFFKRLGLAATCVMAQYYDTNSAGDTEDAYRMEWRL